MNKIFNFDNTMLYAIDYVNTVTNIIESIANDLQIDVDRYEKSLQIIENFELINFASAIYTLSVCDNAIDIVNVQKYTIVIDNLDSQSLMQVNVIADNSNDIVRYTYDNVTDMLERKCVLREKYI